MQEKTILYLLFIISFIIQFSCNSEQNKSNQISSEGKEKEIPEPFVDDFISCDLPFDTIKSDQYTMHQGILKKYHDLDKRGYVFTSEGDTFNNFLYHQDIAEFTSQLDPSEKGIHKIFTNKIVFLILEKEPRMLDIGLTGWRQDFSHLDYFFEHVSNPLCNSISSDSLRQLIQNEMPEHKKGGRIVKKMILDKCCK